MADATGRSYGRGAAVLSVGIGVTGLVTYAYFSLASHTPLRGRLWRHHAAVVGGFHRRLDPLSPRRAAALANDRRPRRPRPRRKSAPARRRDDPARARAAVRRRGARAARSARGRSLQRLGDALLGDDRRGAGLRGQLLRPRLPRRQPPLRLLRAARPDGGDVKADVRPGRRGRDRIGPVDRRARHRGGADRLARGRAVRARDRAAVGAPGPRGRPR